MASCIIYNTKKQYKIVTESLTSIELLIATEPIFILDKTCSKSELWLTILQSLKSSVNGTKIPKKDEWSDWEKKLLTLMEEKSFSKLYKSATACQVKLEKSNLSIIRFVYRPKMGLVVDEDNVYQYSFDEKDEETYIDKLLELLNLI